MDGMVGQVTRGELIDLGYDEFLAHPDHADELLNGGMTTVDGQPGLLKVVGRYAAGVHLAWVRLPA